MIGNEWARLSSFTLLQKQAAVRQPVGAEGLSPTTAKNLTRQTTNELRKGFQASDKTVILADTLILG